MCKQARHTGLCVTVATSTSAACAALASWHPHNRVAIYVLNMVLVDLGPSTLLERYEAEKGCVACVAVVTGSSPHECFTSPTLAALHWRSRNVAAKL